MLPDRFSVRYNENKGRLEVVDTWNKDAIKITMDMDYNMPAHHREYLIEVMMSQCFDLNLEHDERYHYLCQLEDWSGKQVIKIKNIYHPEFIVHNII